MIMTKGELLQALDGFTDDCEITLSALHSDLRYFASLQEVTGQGEYQATIVVDIKELYKDKES